MPCEAYKNCLFVLYSVHSLLFSFYVLPMERKPYEKALLWDDTINFSAGKFEKSSCGTGYSRTAEMKVSDSHSFSTIDSIDCELSVVPDWLGEKVKTVARIKIRTYTAIMPPTMKAIAFQTLFARLFLIASCSLIRESCSANASGCSSASILEPSSRLTGTSKISASFISSSVSGTERPFSHFETVCLTTFSLAASSSCVIPFFLRSAFRLS